MTIERLVGLTVLLLSCGGSAVKPDGGLDATMAADVAEADAEVMDGTMDEGGGDSGTDAGSGCVSAIAVGAFHACAIKTDGSLWCWGKNDQSQLGDGTTMNRSLPVKVPILGNTVVDVSAGALHTCARKSDNTVWCWGLNADSRASGDGDTQNKVVPVQVKAVGTAAAQVSAGEANTCVRKTDGSLWCWGTNAPQVGIGSTGTGVTIPTEVTDLGKTVASASVGLAHACARKTNNTAWCWGANYAGQLGDGTVSMGGCDCKPSPVQSALSSVAEVSAGAIHTCARKTDDSVWCWGGNYEGAIGDGTTMMRSLPTKVTALTNAATVVAGAGYSCAAKKDGTLWCWGNNGFGTLGDGTTTERHTPVKVLNLASVTSVDGSDSFVCALDAGLVWCWGANTFGQLGIGTTGGQDLCIDMTKNCELAPLQAKSLCP